MYFLNKLDDTQGRLGEFGGGLVHLEASSEN